MENMQKSTLSEDKIKKIQDIYLKYIKKALDIKDIEPWAVKKTVTKSVLKQTTKAQENIYKAIDGRNFSEGDKIWLYIKEDPEKPGDVLKKKYKLIEEYDGEHHVWHYIKRIHDTISILENIIDSKNFIKYHNKTNRDKARQLLNPEIIEGKAV